MPEPEEGSLLEGVGSLLRILARRRWWFLPIAAVVTLATVAALLRLPDRYMSEATLLVVEQQVPVRYVAPTTTTSVSEALQAMTQEVLSRARLTAIVSEFGLYTRERRTLPPEKIIEIMLENIGIVPLQGNSGRGNVNSFKISFTADSPDVAQRVTGRLTSLFIAENLKTRTDQATNTTDFLSDQLQSAQAKLAEQEKRLKDFKMQHLGELPEQQQGNLAILSGLQTQLQNTAAAMNRVEQQRVYLESLIRGLESSAALRQGSADAPGPSVTPGPIQDAQREIARLQAERSRLLTVYTSTHPDVVRNSRELEKVEASLTRLQATQTAAGAGTASQSARPAATDSTQEATLAQVRSQLEANRVEAKNLSQDYKNLQASVETYQARLNQTPVREQQMSALLRDNELLRKNYADLLQKRTEAQLATNLERQQAGQRFRLVDAPSLPTRPAGPKRVKMSLIGALAGILLGAGVALLVDIRGRPFYSEKAVRQRFAKMLVVGIPVLLTPGERRLRSWGRAMEWVAGTALVVAVLLAETFVYLHG